MEQLHGKRIVVAGGTTGLGLSAARALIAQGAHVVCFARSLESVVQAKDELGDSAWVFCADATQPESAVEAVAQCVSRFGGLDGLYHVAGGSGRKMGDGPLHEITNEGWDFTMRLNMTSLFYSNRAAVRQFMEQGTGGTILNMGSVLGVYPSPKYFVTHAYAAAKAALVGYTRSVAAYYAAHDIRINGIAPALVETPMSARASEDVAIQSFIKTKQRLDGGRNGRSSDLDAAVVYFMSDGSRFTTGQWLAVDGGWSVSEGQY